MSALFVCRKGTRLAPVVGTISSSTPRSCASSRAVSTSEPVDLSAASHAVGRHAQVDSHAQLLGGQDVLQLIGAGGGGQAQGQRGGERGAGRADGGLAGVAVLHGGLLFIDLGMPR